MHDDDRWEWPLWTWFAIEGYRKNKGPGDSGRGRLLSGPPPRSR